MATGLIQRDPGRIPSGRPWQQVTAILMAVGLSIGTLVSLPADAVAAGVTLRFDPQSTTVDGGETFTVRIVQSADVPTLGTQADIVFEPKLLQILDMEPGPAYSGGLFLYGFAGKSGVSVEAVIAEANGTGVLENVATFLLPGSGTVPPGDAVFVTLTMQAATGAGGTSSLEFAELEMQDENGSGLAVTAMPGSVSVEASAAASGGAVTPPAASASSARPTPSAAVAGVTSDPGATGAPSSVTVAPASLQIDPGLSVQVDLKLTSGAATSGVETDLTFDSKVLEITAVEPGPAWAGATIVAGGAGGQTLAQAIAQANETGVLKAVGVLLLTGSRPAGEEVFLSVTVKGRVDGTSPLALTGVSVLDVNGAPLPVSIANAQLVVGSGGGGAFLPMLIAGLIALAALVGGVGFVMRARRRSEP